MNKIPIAIIATALLPGFTNAHQNNLLKQTELQAKAALISRVGDIPNQSILALAGFMMGGESYSVENGVKFDDIQLLGTKNFNDRYFVSAKLGAHQHGSDGELNIENLWFGTRLWADTFTLEIGRMATEVTPTANYHTAQDTFTEAPLLAEVYFGRHHYETGLRASFDIGDVQLGGEYFNGKSWPIGGEESDGALSVFLNYQLQFGEHRFSSRVWGFTGDAVSRPDERLISDHHNTESGITNLTPYDFSGEVMLAGTLLGYEYKTGDFAIATEFEVIAANQEGTLYDGSQFGTIDSQTQGYRMKQSFTHGEHQVNLQYEYLVADNVFTDTPSLMVESLGLYNDGFEPTRLLFNWRWHFTQDFILVTEYNQEQLSPDNEQQRLALGLLWNWRIF